MNKKEKEMSGIISAQTLVLEVTRRCNLHCRHCLRGEAQCVDMQKSTIDKLMPMLENVEEVVFTGGEPSLNVEAIAYFFEKCRERFHRVPAFYVVTNGKEKDLQLPLCYVLMQAYADTDDKEMCGISISKDEYHSSDGVCRIAEALTFYRDDKDMTKAKYDWVIPEGRAKENGIGQNRRLLKPEFYLINEDDFRDGNDDILEVETLYVSAREEVIGDCDYSYAHIASKKLCTLDVLPLYVKQLREKTA